MARPRKWASLYRDLVSENEALYRNLFVGSLELLIEVAEEVGAETVGEQAADRLARLEAD